MNRVVLVGVLKSKGDLRILLRRRWYRIPAAFAPRRNFEYLAFYQPEVFGARGRRIAYYARVTGRKKLKRIALLPHEPNHVRAHDDYWKFSFAKILTLPKPIKNIIPRRISFGFTTLKRLLASENILELYGVPATEQMMAIRLKRLGIPVRSEYTVARDGKRCRIDLAIFCMTGNIAVECDNRKAHAGRAQMITDRTKDAFLRRNSWRVIRLNEADIIEHPDRCVARVQSAIYSLGGLG